MLKNLTPYKFHVENTSKLITKRKTPNVKYFFMLTMWAGSDIWLVKAAAAAAAEARKYFPQLVKFTYLSLEPLFKQQ